MKDIKTTLELIDLTCLNSQLTPQVQLIDSQTCPCLLAWELRFSKSEEKFGCFRNTSVSVESASLPADEAKCPLPHLPTISPRFSGFTVLEWWYVSDFSDGYTQCHQVPNKEQCKVYCSRSKGSSHLGWEARHGGRKERLITYWRSEWAGTVAGLESSRLPPCDPLPLAKLPPKSSTFPDSSTNWGATVHTPKPVGTPH